MSLRANLPGSKKNLESTFDRSERLGMLEKNCGISVSAQCELLGICRSGVYYKPVRPSAKKLMILNRIDEIFTKYPYYGSRRIAAVLNHEGHSISRPTTSKYMAEMGLSAIYPKKNTSQKHPEHKVYPYLLRNVVAAKPNHIWGTDITYIRMKSSFMYLVAYLDWYSRYVVGFELSDSLADDFVIEALSRALSVSVPEIINSDQGSQFTGRKHTEMLQTAGISISMDGRGRAMDNIFTERLWRTVKYEDVYLRDYGSPRELKVGLEKYFNYYNNKRPHQALGYRTPAEVYQQSDYIKNGT